MRRIPSLLLALAATLPAWTQDDFAAEGRLALVTASVYDDQNRFHAEMASENFRVLDDGADVRLESVGVEEVPLSTVVLLDASRSMRGSLDGAREALGRFLDKAQEGDEVCLLAFQGHVPGDCQFTADGAAVRAQAARLVPEGSTALGDALLTGLAMTKKAHNARRAVLVLSDGLDNASAHRWREVRRMAMESAAVLYTVNLSGWTEMDAWQMLRLRQLAEETGGRMLTARDAREFPALLEHLEVRQQYVLAFVPPRGPGHGTEHHVTVRLRGKAAEHLRVYWRHSYSTVVH